MEKISRRTAVKLLASTGAAMCVPKIFAQADDANVASNAAVSIPAKAVTLPPAPVPIVPPPGFGIAAGPFKPTLESLSAFQVPDWSPVRRTEPCLGAPWHSMRYIRRRQSRRRGLRKLRAKRSGLVERVSPRPG